MDGQSCAECGRETEAGYTLCERCELTFALLLLRYVPWTHALEASLDATLHPGGHQPTRAATPFAPTPIRLDVLDHLDLLASTAQGLWRRLEGVDPLDWRRDLCPDTIGCLLDGAAHPRLARIPDAPMYLHEFQRLRSRTLDIIDAPDHPTPIGQCLRCGMTINAGPAQTHVTCPICGCEQSTMDVRLDLLHRSIQSGRAFTAGECASLLQGCGYAISAATIRSWKHRGLLASCGSDDNGRPVYRLRDVVALLRSASPI